LRRSGLLVAGILLALCLACAGGAGAGNGQGSTAKLVYAAPADTTAWWLKLDPASTSTRLILDLMAPAGTSGQGVTLILSADPGKATWHAFTSGSYLQGLIYPGALVSKASVSGSSLRIVAAQASAPVAYTGTTPVLQVGLDLATGASAGNAALTPSAAGHLGAGATAADAITVQAGTLQVQ